MRRRAVQLPLLFFVLICLAVPSATVAASDRVQRTIAFTETLLPLAFMLTQGTDTDFEAAVFGASVVLHSVPNALMLFGEATGRPGLTRITRWANFGIDAATAAGLVGTGIAYLVGAFGPEADLRSTGAYYLALSIPAGIAAFSDFLPYAVEESGSIPDGPEPIPDGSGEGAGPE